MARKTIVELVDDIDGGEASETVSFGLDGVAYEIDLSEKNAGKLRTALGKWSSKARRVGGRKQQRARSGEDTGAIRAWAQTQGYTLGDRGRIPTEVRDAYKSAH